MSVLAARIGLMVLIAAGAAAVVRAATVQVIRGDSMDAMQRDRASQRRPDARPVSDSLVAQAVRRPLFRPSRRPGTVGFDPARGMQTVESAPAADRPKLAVSGIVWGPEPAAIVEGLPGVEGSVVLRRGEAAGGIRAVRIDRARVVLAGLDTTWSLQVRDPWR